MDKKNKEGLYSDEELIRTIMEGGAARRKTAKYLYDLHFGYIYSGIKRFKLPQEEVEDAYADAIVALISQVGRGAFKGNSKISTYLFSIFSNKCKTRLSNLKYRDVVDISEINHLPDRAKNRLQMFVEAGEFNHLLHLLDQVGKKCRQIIVDSEIYGYDYSEIAERIGFKNAASVHSMRYRCVERIKKMIKEATTEPFRE